MSFHSYNQADFDRWKNALTRMHTQPGWDMHDVAIRRSVDAYSRFHSGHSGYIGPSWQLIKAMIWTEGGGPAFGDEWRLRPMQIGVVRGGVSDPGIFDIVRPQTAIVVPPQLFHNFTVAGIRNSAELNIQAGLALLHLKMATFLDKPAAPAPMAAMAAGVQKVVAGAQQALSGTRMSNHPGPPLPAAPGHGAAPAHTRHHQHPRPHPKTEKYIAAWAPFCPVLLYQRYNVGDAAYASKLEFCLQLMSADSRRPAHP